MKNNIKNIGYLLLPVIIYILLSAFHNWMQLLTSSMYLLSSMVLDDLIAALVIVFYCVFAFRAVRRRNSSTPLFMLLGAAISLAVYFVMMFGFIFDKTFLELTSGWLYCFAAAGANIVAAIELMLGRKREKSRKN